jgi:hypothetical protein
MNLLVIMMSIDEYDHDDDEYECDHHHYDEYDHHDDHCENGDVNNNLILS